MPYLHDVWVNWSVGAEYSWEVPYFHEWEKSDGIDICSTMIALKVDNKLFDYVTNGYNEIPVELYQKVEGKGKEHVNGRTKTITAFVLYDGDRSMAIQSEDLNKPTHKSRLIPRQERLVADLLDFASEVECEVPEQPERFDEHYTHAMIGLTRKEKQKKNLLINILESDFSDSDSLKLKYWYGEFNYGKLPEVQSLSTEELISKLKREVWSGWSEKHENLLKLAVQESSHMNQIYQNILKAQAKKK